jgi:sterol desaturase/sphingolipid hydroxylase (fatty acid hydroxylase superfamily)
MPFGLDVKTLVAAAVLAVLWVAETWAPFYDHFGRARGRRLAHDGRNLLVGIVNGVAVGLAFGALAALGESWAHHNGFGLLRAVSLPAAFETAAAFLLLDLWMYAWHRANHAIPFLWRFHRMHHSDARMDATTGVRFHAGEVAMSAALRLGLMSLLGISVAQAALYEAVMLPVVLVHHSNVRLPRWLEYGLLPWIVMPAMHRVHHSRLREETDSNYGSVFPWWDRLLDTYRRREDVHSIRLGLDELDGPQWQGLGGMLATPLI